MTGLKILPPYFDCMDCMQAIICSLIFARSCSSISFNGYALLHRSINAWSFCMDARTQSHSSGFSCCGAVSCGAFLCGVAICWTGWVSSVLFTGCWGVSGALNSGSSSLQEIRVNVNSVNRIRNTSFCILIRYGFYIIWSVRSCLC